MSFKDKLADNKLGILHLNELSNVESRFEVLEGVNTDDLAMINKEQAKL